MSTLTDELYDLAADIAARADDAEYVGLATFRLLSIAARVGTLEAHIAPPSARCERLPPEVIDGRDAFRARRVHSVPHILPRPWGPGDVA